MQSVLIELNSCDICTLSGKHKLFAEEVFFGFRLAWVLRLLGFLLEFFDSVSISESVEGVFAAGIGRADIGNHSGFAVSSEGILEHLGEFAASEGQVFLLQIESSDAFFKG